MTCDAALLSLHDDCGNPLGVRLGHGRTPGNIQKTTDLIDLLHDILNTSWMRRILMRAVGSWQSWAPRAHINLTRIWPHRHTVGSYSASALP